MSSLLLPLAFAGLWLPAHGHITIKSPVPFKGMTTSPLNNVAPDAPNSQFPCQRPNYQIDQMNNVAYGQPQTLSFNGEASHGGGSCQLSMTMDLEPSPNSTFKVIQSYVGGCPLMPSANGQASGNGGTSTYQYTIDPRLPSGRFTLAWNWVSRMSGQPENYMNCAPMQGTGGANDLDFYNSLPDMLLINQPSTSCGTNAGLSENLQYPDPGPFVTTIVSSSMALPTGSACPKPGSSSGGSSGGGAPGGGAGGSSASAPAPQPSAPASSSSAGVSLTTSTTSVTGAGSAPTGGAGGAYPSASVSVGDGGASASASAPAASGSSSSGGAGGSCSTAGAIVCNGPDQFGLCDNGNVVWQSVAAGTTCSNGQIQKRHWMPPHRRSLRMSAEH